MKSDPYMALESVDWTASKKKMKEHYCFERELKLSLHKDHAIVRTNPETFKPEKVHGEVLLMETKLIDKGNSSVTIYRNLKDQPGSVVEKVIQ